MKCKKIILACTELPVAIFAFKSFKKVKSSKTFFDPNLILADEPTSALDVVVQRQIMQTLTKLQQKLGASVLLVGHDMGLMAQFAERIGIMYQGNLVEGDTAENIFTKPQHPYTKSLISSIPSFERKDRLELQSENKVSSQN